MKLPREYIEEIRNLLGDDADEYFRCLDAPRLYGLRVNTSKISVSDFQKISPFQLTPIPWIENGFYYDIEKDMPSKHPFYHAGLYYLQEPSAMTPANKLPVCPGCRVLDLCAAPGGKTTELCAKTGREGMVIANDISAGRLKALLKNVEISGYGNAIIANENSRRLSLAWGGFFDRVLIDAPCSGEGMFRKDRKVAEAWKSHGPAFFYPIQRQLIRDGGELLSPGGMMMYSTCTFNMMENERIIAEFLAENENFSLVDIQDYPGFARGYPYNKMPDVPMSAAVRIFPHRMAGEGHFLALLKKEGERESHKQAPMEGHRGLNKLPSELTDFFAHMSCQFVKERLRMYGEGIYYVPGEIPDLQGIRLLRTGLFMGCLRKKRFEPSGALAMFLKREEFDNVLNLSIEDDRVLRYLKGETLMISEDEIPCRDGWVLVCVEGYPLGWGKKNRQMIKNKYLPGWRYGGG